MPHCISAAASSGCYRCKFNSCSYRQKRIFSPSFLWVTAIVKLSERYSKPFLIKVPFTSLRNETITDAKITERMKAMIDVSEIKKFDTEFTEVLINPEKAQKIHLNINDDSIDSISDVKIEITPLTNIQEILLDFVKEEVGEGKNLKEIESILEEQLSRNLYTKEDIVISIDSAFGFKSPEKVEIEKPLSEPSIHTIKEDFNKLYPFFKSLSSDEKAFMKYIIENPKHKHSTVELYKVVGLSARKGNVVKTALSEKGLLEIEEQKNDKGWKKYIRMSKSCSQN